MILTSHREFLIHIYTQRMLNQPNLIVEEGEKEQKPDDLYACGCSTDQIIC